MINDNSIQYPYSPEFFELTKLIDPIQNMDKMEHIPKYFIVSSSDEFMMSHWPNMYWDKITGEKYLYIIANTDHSLITGLQ